MLYAADYTRQLKLCTKLHNMDPDICDLWHAKSIYFRSTDRLRIQWPFPLNKIGVAFLIYESNQDRPCNLVMSCWQSLCSRSWMGLSMVVFQWLDPNFSTKKLPQNNSTVWPLVVVIYTTIKVLLQQQQQLQPESVKSYRGLIVLLTRWLNVISLHILMGFWREEINRQYQVTSRICYANETECCCCCCYWNNWYDMKEYHKNRKISNLLNRHTFWIFV